MRAILAFGVRSLGLAALIMAAGCAAPEKAASPARPVAIKATAAGSYLMARQAARARDAERAAESYRGALARDPGHRMLIPPAFFAELERGRIPAALALIKAGDEAGVTLPLMHLVLAVDRARSDDWAEARTHLVQIPKSPLSQGLVPLLEAWIAASRNDWPAAQEKFGKAGEIAGFEALALQHLGHAARLAGERDAADRAFRDALAKRPGPSTRLIVSASLHFAATGRPDMAREILAEQPDPDLDIAILHGQIDRVAGGRSAPDLVNSGADGISEALFDVANALRQKANDTAMIVARLALYARPSNALARILVGDILDRRERHAKALDVYRAVPETSAFRLMARLRAAESLNRMGQQDEAIRDLRALAGEQPNAPGPWIQIGDIESDRKRWVDAVAAYGSAFERVDGKQPRHWRLYFTRGIALERDKQWDRAEADFLTALELSPDQPYVMNYLGYSWTEQGVNLDRAEEMIEKAVALRPNDGYIVDSLGWIFYRTGRYGEAVEQLEHAVRLRPNDPTINDHLGDAYWRVGRQVEARYQWRRALGMDPEADQLDAIETKLKKGLPPPEATGAGDRKAADGDLPGA